MLSIVGLQEAGIVMKISNELGVITLKKDVIAQLAGATAVECFGIVGMARVGNASGIVALLKRDQLSKGVEVKQSPDGLIIKLHVIMQFGTKISAIASNIISQVKYNVERMTGLEVASVDISIESVRVRN